MGGLPKGRRLSRGGNDALAEAAAVTRRLRSAGVDRYEPFGLTDLQSAYWQGQHPELDLGGIQVHYLYEFDFPQLDLDRLEGALNRVIEHHPMLRAVVDADGRQRILPSVPTYRIGVTDLSSKDEASERRILEEAREQYLRRGPTFDSWPSLRIRAFRRRGGSVRLQVDMPLLLIDGTSVEIVLRDLQQLYADPSSELNPADIWPRDYLMAITAERKNGPYRRSLEYWRQRLDSLPAGPDLPLRVDSAVSDPRFYQHWGEVDESSWGRFKELAGRHGVTTATALATAYGEAVGTWSRSQRFLLNVLTHGRVRCHPHISRLVGNYTSTVMLEVDHTVAGEPFVDRATRLRATLKRDLEHARVSGVQVARELARRLGGLPRPIAPVVFASQLNPPKLRDPDAIGPWGDFCTFESVQTPQVWIDHQVKEHGGRAMFFWDAVDDLFPAGLIDTIFTAYCERLQDLSRNEDAWTRSSRCLVPVEQLEQRAKVNRTEAEYPANSVLHSLFLEQAQARPDALAVAATERRLTYSELASWTEALAQQLPGSGLVAIYMRRGWQQVVAALGILRAGAAYLPLDPAHPDSRIEILLDNANVEVVITQPELASRAGAFGRQVLVVDQPLDPVSASEPLPSVQPDQLAYVIYTSGSTGTPKGVMIDHRGAINTIFDINRRFGVTEKDRVLALASLSFDLSVYDIFGSLAAGAAVVVPDAELDRDPAHWVDLIEREKVTVWNSVPQLLVMLVEYLRYRDSSAASGLELILLSGDWVPVQLPDQIRAIAPRATVIAMGGATEASIWSIFHRVEQVDPTWKSIPYGRPLANQSWHVLNEAFEPSPIWVPGELYIGGIGVALGYLGDEAITNAKFIEHADHGRLYRTGDLGRYLPDGSIEFLGREDAQVKIQGYRIELGEIEAALAEHPDVRAAVVVAQGDVRGERSLAGFVVSRSGEIDTSSLRQFAEKRLPTYMVPTTLTELAELPLSANGKVDRKALAVKKPRRSDNGAPQPPTGDLERRLCAIWEELLELKPIGVDQNFFELGGQSFVAVRLMARIYREFGADLPVTSLITAPTVEALASMIESRKGSESPLVLLNQGPAASRLFCVHPSGGSVLCYRDLAGRLAEHVAFFGLEAPGLRGDLDVHRSTEDLAAFYADAIRSEQPSGPYRLAGWSSGGAVALAIAHVLRDAGEEVSSLILLDTDPPGIAGPEDEDDELLTRMFVSDLLLLGAGAEVATAAVNSLVGIPKSDGATSAAQSAFSRLRERSLLPEDLSEERFVRLYSVYAANLRGQHAYQPRPYAGKALLLLARDGFASEVEDPAGLWLPRFVGAPQVAMVPGDHYSMFAGDNLDVLVSKMVGALRGPDGSAQPNTDGYAEVSSR